jgi:hypothetical protein
MWQWELDGPDFCFQLQAIINLDLRAQHYLEPLESMLDLIVSRSMEHLPSAGNFDPLATANQPFRPPLPDVPSALWLSSSHPPTPIRLRLATASVVGWVQGSKFEAVAF